MEGDPVRSGVCISGGTRYNAYAYVGHPGRYADMKGIPPSLLSGSQTCIRQSISTDVTVYQPMSTALGQAPIYSVDRPSHLQMWTFPPTCCPFYKYKLTDSLLRAHATAPHRQNPSVGLGQCLYNY